MKGERAERAKIEIQSRVKSPPACQRKITNKRVDDGELEAAGLVHKTGGN